MPSFNTTDDPIGHDGYGLAVTDSSRSRRDASVVGFSPAAAADWSGGVDPGAVDDGLDQLASRVSVNETTLGGLSSDHGELSGLSDDDHAQYLLADGTRAVAGDLTVSGDNELRFRGASQRVLSSVAGALDLEAGTLLNIAIDGQAQAVWSDGKLEFQNGAATMAFTWPVAGQLGVKLGATTVGEFRLLPEVQLDVAGIVRGSGVRADAHAPGGLANTTTMTAGTRSPAPAGSKATLDLLPAGFTTSPNTGWMEFKVGTTTAIVPYWT